MSPDSPALPLDAAPDPEWLALVREQVRNLRYGVVQLVVHDGRVTQIERTEKVRLASDRPDRPGR
ncbi:MAG TPA: YezD family protein [Opitutaceae bacterium]